MSLPLQTFFRVSGLFLIVFFCAGVVLSQEDEEDLSPPPVPIKSVRSGVAKDEEDKTGAIVRGRAFYEDTGKPVRRGWIGFIKIRELAVKGGEQTKEVFTRGGSGSYNAEKYVLTSDQGEFVIKGVKAGVYMPTLKVKGVLNPEYSDLQNPLFQQIQVDGTNEVQVTVGVKRGGAVSGRILYPDGEPVIGAKVQILKKQDRANQSYTSYTSGESITIAVTDDRGFYRFAGLPANEYFVRVTEPSVHSDSEKPVSSYEMTQYNDGSELKTFYPSVSDIKEAKPVVVVLGQESGDVDIQIPDRRLFKISGSVVGKNNKKPLDGMKVTFEKVVEGRGFTYNSYDRSKQTTTDEQGNWTFKDLPKGKYRVSVSMNDGDYYSTNSPEPKPKTDSPPKYAPLAKEIEVEDKDLQDLVFELAAEATISGTIAIDGDKPFPNYVSIFVFDHEKKMDASTFINNYDDAKNAENKNSARKPFRIGKLSEGKFVFNASSEQDYYIKSIKMGSTDLMKTPLELKDGQEISGVQIVLGTDVGILKGQLNNYKADGGRAFIVAIPTEAVALGVNGMQRSSAGIVMPNGAFELKAAPGEYFVIVGTDKNRPDPEKQSLDQWFRELVKDAPKVTLKAGETQTISLNYPDK